jgi:exonuclease SbcC
MTLFDSFNKPSWQHRNPENRKSAIEDIADIEVLVQLVREDPDGEVRSLALTSISDVKILEDFVNTLVPPLQNQAKTQWLKLLLPESGQLSEMTDDKDLINIANLTDDPELIVQCIDRVGSTDTLMELALAHPSAKIRIAAARGIKAEDHLKELISQCRHKDKSVYRYCKERLDLLHAARRTDSERSHKIIQLSEDAQCLSKAADSPEYKSRLQVLEHRWAPLKEFASPEQQQQIEDDLEICTDRINLIKQEVCKEEEQHSRVEEARQAFQKVLGELGEMNLSELNLADINGIKTFTKHLDEIEDQWLAAIQFARPDTGQTKECKSQLSFWRSVAQVSKRLCNKRQALNLLHEQSGSLAKADFMAHHKLLQKVERHLAKLPWPESGSPPPDPIVQLQGLRDTLLQRLENLKQQESKKLQQLDQAFDALRKELDDSHFNNADRIHNKIRNLLRHLGPDHQDRFHQELRPLTARLSEIHDWQGFAIEPKKIKLCERMTALIGCDETADALAEKIRALQSEWKSLGHISPHRDQALWKNFHAAAEKAYKPCKQAFEQQSRARKENLKLRMTLVEQLVDYDNRMNWPDSSGNCDGAEPDWRMVQKTLDTARKTFNDIKPVDGKGERKSRKALQLACDSIYGHIKDEYARNITRKEALVSEAKTLADLEDLRDAISRAKDIQHQWKNVGLTPRQVDRKLWKELRAACDAVFGRLDEQRKVDNAAKNERAEQARLRAQKESQRWPCLLDRMTACALKEEDGKKATRLWEQESNIPKGIDGEALADWWQSGPDTSAPEDVLREACIAMEILLDIDSPAEDREVRMAYQMKRLVDGLGTAQAEQSDRLLEQINEFIALKPPLSWLDRFCCDGMLIPQKNRQQG